MITFNHERFIAQALESALGQLTTFPIEVVIGEDCSTDSTREIVARYAAQHSNINAIMRDRNVGAHANLEGVMSACRGEYIAFLEGDDYWTDKSKLARQVEVLDHRVNAALCYHDVEVVDDVGNQIAPRMRVGTDSGQLTIHDILVGRHIPTCSVVGRKAFYAEYPRWFYDLGMSDWPLHILAARHGPALFLRGGGAAYRRHPGGSWSGGSRSYVSWLATAARMYDHLARELPEEYRASVSAGRAALGPKLADHLDDLAQREVETLVALRIVQRALAEWPDDVRLPDAGRRTLKGDFVARESFRRYRLGDRIGALTAAAVLPYYRPRAAIAKAYWASAWKCLVDTRPGSPAKARR